MPTTRVADLIEITAALTNLRPVDIKGHRRNQIYVRARQAVCYVARQQGVHSYPQIGRMLGDRDHSTIIHGARKAEIIAERDPVYRKLLDDILAQAEAADPWVKVLHKETPHVKVAISLDMPKPLRPMFACPPPEDERTLADHKMIRKGSKALLAALLAA